MTLRIGIIGAGGNTRLRHIPGFQKLPDVQVTAVCNRSVASGQKVADEFGIANVFADWQQLIADSSVDAICIGTWPYMHCPIALAALAAGRHVLTEARLAMNLAEARQMLNAAERSDRVSMVVPAPFYLASEALLLEMIDAGEFGELIEAHVSGLTGAYDPNGALQWRQRRDLSGNNIMSMGIFNETVRRYLGHERHVLAHGKTFIAERTDPDTGQRRKADVPDAIGIVAEHQNGALCVYHFSSVATLGRTATFEFHGTQGAFKLEANKAWVAKAGARSYQELEVPEARRGGWRVEEEFVEAIRSGTPITHTTFADAVKYMEFTEAVNISLREGRRVTLPL